MHAYVTHMQATQPYHCCARDDPGHRASPGQLLSVDETQDALSCRNGMLAATTPQTVWDSAVHGFLLAHVLLLVRLAHAHAHAYILLVHLAHAMHTHTLPHTRRVHLKGTHPHSRHNTRLHTCMCTVAPWRCNTQAELTARIRKLVDQPLPSPTGTANNLDDVTVGIYSFMSPLCLARAVETVRPVSSYAMHHAPYPACPPVPRTMPSYTMHCAPCPGPGASYAARVILRTTH